MELKVLLWGRGKGRGQQGTDAVMGSTRVVKRASAGWGQGGVALVQAREVLGWVERPGQGSAGKGWTALVELEVLLWGRGKGRGQQRTGWWHSRRRLQP